MKALAAAAMLVAVVLAGCSDGGSDDETDRDSISLAAGKGAIAGLLVDDRFRPIQLTETAATTEFQAKGFVLLQETGQQARTTANGEFFFVDLDPGSYTLRVSATGHEAAPTKVNVAAGVFAEQSIVARRLVETGGLILTQDFAIFIDCWTSSVVLWTEMNCFADLSRDSKRGALRYNFSSVPDVTYVVAEFLMNEPGNYRVDLGWGDGEAVTDVYASRRVDGGDYGKIIVSRTGDGSEDPEWVDGHLPDPRLLAVLWPQGEPIETPATTLRPGFGVAVEAQVLVSLFLGEPEVDLPSYCVLCG